MLSLRSSSPTFIQSGGLTLRFHRPHIHDCSKKLNKSQAIYHQRKRSANIVTMASDRKMLHAVYRVGDLPATRKFLQTLGMHVLRERDIPSEKYTNVFYGFGPEQKGEFFSLELTYNYGVDSYDVGTGFGHISVAVTDLTKILADVKDAGFTITRDAAPGIGGSGLTAYVTDPTGYTFELVERKQRDPLCQVMLRITDMDKSIEFYKAMGMNVLKKLDENSDGTSRVMMGFGSEDDSTAMQLVYTPGEQSYTTGDGYGQIAVSCPDVYEAAKQFEQVGIPIARAPGPVPGIGTKITAIQDPDGWKTVMVDADDFEKEFE